MKQAIKNDEHLEQEEDIPPKKESEKVLVWPNLVYTEFICMIILTVALVIWSILIKAPLEQPASPSKAPNPSKAPWYFLGLQEMLVYYDPWIAGVVVPSIAIVGLMAIPYIDINPKGSGYYSFKERKFAVTMFLFGFTILWVYLINIGTFLRGPNWNFFGPYEEWDIHKLVSLVNVNLSEIIYIKWFGVGLPKHWLIREIFGFLLTGLYFTAIPVVLAKTWFKGFYEKMGTTRFGILMLLFLSMMSLPMKMYLRWAFNLKYIIAIPEYFFNI
ncbi:MAG: cytochrome C [Candidatus Latescibacteria bacterium]|nr:cytochrome C [Candidatus Latescibacterota bacterium]